MTSPAATAETFAQTGPLADIKVVDLTRILAGPTAAQLLGDLGADVVKIERPGKGDDTRGWGPPFVKDADGNETAESAYYLCANRNKRSIAVDLSRPEGQEIIRRLVADADVVLENYKVGQLARYGLDYESLSQLNPKIVYCSITGFGQTGPYAPRAGYDFMIQGMGGIMSLTGFPDEDGGRPTKVGVGIADVMCGMYAANAIQAALHAREKTGKGQYIDLALFDTQISWLINQALAFLTSGEVPGRLGNAHPTVVPYETFAASDGDFIIAAGNDGQFRRLCEIAGRPELADDPRFATNRDRVVNRAELIPAINAFTRTRTAADWISALEVAGIPCGPINDLGEVFDHPQAVHRGAKVTMPHATSATGTVDLIGNPIKMSETPVSYRRAPPRLGEHTLEVLAGELGYSSEDIERLSSDGIVEIGT
ncbi:CaiB/BaiF CoA transferase family protein [Amorphus orientalis]|uniref:Crotonobetainyl-CoA:carnitine CoA-transferase CaiB-like acyl-CoA transferase n=1 Tax=Amorphus orientalis TaxID=649198 RepID=A0AAE4ATB1_9HYPH|nr:CaiB/BaiF CoA-transferase family protein [Amorphus orientalis]MDQ0315987.1 crotonobetainyl-CoA:carnitine CoA-transferase CaiB-like acyl-CoA transferase [Amorphus orientalis]